MNPDEHDQLWALLGKAKKPDVSPFFARDILREIRSQQPARIGFVAWLQRSWRVTIPVGAAALVTVLSVGVLQQHKQSSATVQIASNPDYEVISDLDELVASEENSIWLENSTD